MLDDLSEDSDSEDRGEGGSMFSMTIGEPVSIETSVLTRGRDFAPPITGLFAAVAAAEDIGVGGKTTALVVTYGRDLGVVTGPSAAALEDVMVMLLLTVGRWGDVCVLVIVHPSCLLRDRRPLSQPPKTMIRPIRAIVRSFQIRTARIMRWNPLPP